MWLRKYLKDMMSSWVNSIFRFSVQYVNLLESLCIMSESLLFILYSLMIVTRLIMNIEFNNI